MGQWMGMRMAACLGARVVGSAAMAVGSAAMTRLDQADPSPAGSAVKLHRRSDIADFQMESVRHSLGNSELTSHPKADGNNGRHWRQLDSIRRNGSRVSEGQSRYRISGCFVKPFLLPF